MVLAGGCTRPWLVAGGEPGNFDSDLLVDQRIGIRAGGLANVSWVDLLVNSVWPAGRSLSANGTQDLASFAGTPRGEHVVGRPRPCHCLPTSLPTASCDEHWEVAPYSRTDSVLYSGGSTRTRICLGQRQKPSLEGLAFKRHVYLNKCTTL